MTILPEERQGIEKIYRIPRKGHSGEASVELIYPTDLILSENSKNYRIKRKT